MQTRKVKTTGTATTKVEPTTPQQFVPLATYQSLQQRYNLRVEQYYLALESSRLNRQIQHLHHISLN